MSCFSSHTTSPPPEEPNFIEKPKNRTPTPTCRRQHIAAASSSGRPRFLLPLRPAPPPPPSPAAASFLPPPPPSPAVSWSRRLLPLLPPLPPPSASWSRRYSKKLSSAASPSFRRILPPSNPVRRAPPRGAAVAIHGCRRGGEDECGAAGGSRRGIPDHVQGRVQLGVLQLK
ncbi:hypothetical protein BRADI_2g08655v3 [Brachypodium distachyon]|uniref:Uncharacterized protein n=1 Tax=Brachypodium distachyon TaxID=15368 RepID=A0A0Q3ICE5_BRADI|nr:hypothetical protein BRADI_2g08655v3 [Brachypodium distachyon]